MIMMNTLFQETEIWLQISKYTAGLSTQKQKYVFTGSETSPKEKGLYTPTLWKLWYLKERDKYLWTKEKSTGLGER